MLSNVLFRYIMQIYPLRICDEDLQQRFAGQTVLDDLFDIEVVHICTGFEIRVKPYIGFVGDACADAYGAEQVGPVKRPHNALQCGKIWTERSLRSCWSRGWRCEMGCWDVDVVMVGIHILEVFFVLMRLVVLQAPPTEREYSWSAEPTTWRSETKNGPYSFGQSHQRLGGVLPRHVCGL